MTNQPGTDSLGIPTRIIRFRLTAIVSLLLVTVIGCVPATRPEPPPAPAGLMTPAELRALPSTPADHRISYGEDPNQFGELRVPSSRGPHPVAILIHGGCWSAFGTLRDFDAMADALKAEGIATWNIEYRRLPQPGSGWPGTFLDMGQAVDHLRLLASQHNLDLNRVVVVGHSSGGHLATWVAARPRLPRQSDLYVDSPLPVRGVVSLAGAGAMEEYIGEPTRVCRAPVVEQMMGGTPTEAPTHYAQGSPINMLPLGVPQVLISGRSPLSPTWPAIRQAIQSLLAGTQVR